MLLVRTYFAAQCWWLIDRFQFYLPRSDVTWYYPMVGTLAAISGTGCALIASLLPLPSLATISFTRAIHTNSVVLSSWLTYGIIISNP